MGEKLNEVVTAGATILDGGIEISLVTDQPMVAVALIAVAGLGKVKGICREIRIIHAIKAAGNERKRRSRKK